MHRWILPPRLPKTSNPLLVQQARERAQLAQNRVADAITTFAGSMAFVYVHILWFGSWIILGVEAYPFGLLTMVVSLEAIFLSTFILISQNRADARRQVISETHWQAVETAEKQDARLVELTEQILSLTKEVRGFAELAQEDHDQNTQLLDLSRRTLGVVEQLRNAAPDS